MVAAMAIMASMALPPSARMARPLSAASAWGAATAAAEKTGVSGIRNFPVLRPMAALPCTSGRLWGSAAAATRRRRLGQLSPDQLAPPHDRAERDGARRDRGLRRRARRRLGHRRPPRARRRGRLRVDGAVLARRPLRHGAAVAALDRGRAVAGPRLTRRRGRSPRAPAREAGGLAADALLLEVAQRARVERDRRLVLLLVLDRERLRLLVHGDELGLLLHQRLDDVVRRVFVHLVPGDED